MFVIWGTLWIQNPGGSQRYVFFRGGINFFADFLNPIIYSRDLNPYFDPINGFGTKQSLPLVYLFFYPFSKFLLGTNPSDFSLETLQYTGKALWSVWSVLIVSSGLLFGALSKLSTVQHKKGLLLLGLSMSGVYLFSLERGNIVLLSAGCVALFCACYKGEKKEQVSGAIALALAGVMKIYPVIFGFLWIYTKRFRVLCRTAVLTLGLSLFPFAFLRGSFGDNFFQALLCVKESELLYAPSVIYPRFSIPHLGLRLYTFLCEEGAAGALVLKLGSLITLILVGLSIIAAGKEKYEWRRVCLLGLCLIFFPTQSGFYTGLYLFPAIILFFNQKTYFVSDVIYMVLFCIFLSPIQFFAADNYIISNLALILVWGLLLYQSYKNLGPLCSKKYGNNHF